MIIWSRLPQKNGFALHANLKLLITRSLLIMMEFVMIATAFL